MSRLLSHYTSDSRQIYIKQNAQEVHRTVIISLFYCWTYRIGPVTFYSVLSSLYLSLSLSLLALVFSGLFQARCWWTLAHKCTETHLLLMHSIWMDIQVILSMCVSYGSHRKWLKITATPLRVMQLLFANSAIILMLSYSHMQTDINLTANESKVKVVLMNSSPKMRMCWKCTHPQAIKM